MARPPPRPLRPPYHQFRSVRPTVIFRQHLPGASLETLIDFGDGRINGTVPGLGLISSLDANEFKIM